MCNRYCIEACLRCYGSNKEEPGVMAAEGVRGSRVGMVNTEFRPTTSLLLYSERESQVKKAKFSLLY